MSDKTLVFQAAPFCFGPISTTLSVIDGLVDTQHRFIVIDEGPTGDLTKRSDLPIQRVHLSTSRPFDATLRELIESADLVVSNTDPGFAAECMALGAQVAVIDTLFWMWDSLPASLLDAPVFIAQAFDGNLDQFERLGRPQHYVEVGPLVNAQPSPLIQTEREKIILVSLGGCDCFLFDPAQDPYPGLVLKALEQALDQVQLRDYRVMLCCGERASCTLSPTNSMIEIRTLSKEEYIHALRRARAVILSPGLTGSMEAFEAQTPVFFLPPQNYSQVLQLASFRNANTAPNSFAWGDAFPDFSLTPYLPEEAAVARVRQVIDQLKNTPDAHNKLTRSLQDFLQVGMHHYDPQPGRHYRESLGLDGPKKAAQTIKTFLDS